MDFQLEKRNKKENLYYCTKKFLMIRRLKMTQYDGELCYERFFEISAMKVLKL